MSFCTITQINTLQKLKTRDFNFYTKKFLTVPDRISCGQQFNKNGRQTRRSSNDILDLFEPVICIFIYENKCLLLLKRKAYVNIKKKKD